MVTLFLALIFKKYITYRYFVLTGSCFYYSVFFFGIQLKNVKSKLHSHFLFANQRSVSNDAGIQRFFKCLCPSITFKGKRDSNPTLTNSLNA